MSVQQFTPTQQRAVYSQASVIIRAGAGSGKTRVLTERLLNFLECGVSPSRILAVTFTDQAAVELRGRVLTGAKLRSESDPAIWLPILPNLPLMQVSTLHSLCARVARDHAAESGAGLCFEVLEPTDAELWRQQHFSQVLSELPPEVVAAVPARLRGEVLREILNDPLRAEKALQRALASQGPDALALKVNHLYQHIQQRFSALKAEMELAMFADLERWAWTALQHQQVRDHYAGRWTHVLLDEAQDTTPQQWAILHALLDTQSNLTVVGDEKQSIYAFRGADAGVFTQATKIVLERGGDELSMHQSFRTAPELLNPLNAGLAQLMLGPDIKHPTATAFQPLEASRPTNPNLAIPRLELQIVQGGHAQSRAESVASLFAGRMQTLIGHPIFDRNLADWRGARLSDMALLIRSRTHLKTFEHALREAGLPYVVHGGLGLYERPEVQDAITFLRALADPSDDLLLTALLRGVYLNWTDDAILALSQSCRAGESLWHALQATDPSTAQQVKSWREASATLSASQLLTLADEQTGAAQVHAALSSGARRVANLRLLHQLLRRWAQAGDRDLLRVARKLGQLQRLHAQEGEAPAPHADAIQVMTVHASKGLEFPIVFYADALQHAPPPPPHMRFDPHAGLVMRVGETKSDPVWLKTQESAAERERSELERLNYVALTRAADQLILAVSAGESAKQRNHLQNFVAAFPSSVPRTYFAAGDVPFSPPLQLREARGRLLLDLHIGPSLALPGQLPVTSLSSYARCPRQFAYRYLADYLPLARLWCEERDEAKR